MPGISPHESFTKEEADNYIKQSEAILKFVDEEIDFFLKEMQKEEDEKNEE